MVRCDARHRALAREVRHGSIGHRDARRTKARPPRPSTHHDRSRLDVSSAGGSHHADDVASMPPRVSSRAREAETARSRITSGRTTRRGPTSPQLQSTGAPRSTRDATTRLNFTINTPSSTPQTCRYPTPPPSTSWDACTRALWHAPRTPRAPRPRRPARNDHRA